MFLFIFIVLTIAHPIADFILQNRTNRKAHFWFSLNPFHAVWDLSFNMHAKYMDPNFRLKEAESLNLSLINNDYFWFFLGIDQTVHMILNLIWAWILAAILEFLIG